MIIGVSGFIGSGKDTVADYLVDKHGFVRMSFGSTLKDVCAALFDWDREMLEGKTERHRTERELPDPFWSTVLKDPDFSPRKALQQIGTEVMRNAFHENIWVRALENKMRYPHIVISDLRFANEMKMIRSYYGSECWRIQRGVNPTWWGVEDRVEGVHESETALSKQKFERTILNDGSLEELYTQIDTIIEPRMIAYREALNSSVS